MNRKRLKQTLCALGFGLMLFLGYHLATLPAKPTLYLYNWAEYLPASLIQQFTEETGIHVVYTTYDSNESLYAKLSAHPDAAYDVVVPSSYCLNKLRLEGRLLKLDASQLPNLQHLDPWFLGQACDPEDQYSVPYIWGATGIGINTDQIDPTTVKHWSDLWDKRFRGKVLLLDDAREVLQVCLMSLGLPPNTQKPEDLQKLIEKLAILRQNVWLFNSDAPQYPYVAGEIGIGMLWNGAARVAKAQGYPVEFIWPQEGAVLWLDHLAIPIRAPHPQHAHAFINFLMRPEVAAKITLLTGFPNCNRDAKVYLPDAFAKDPLLYPDRETVMASSQWLESAEGMQRRYEEIFQRFKLGV